MLLSKLVLPIAVFVVATAAVPVPKWPFGRDSKSESSRQKLFAGQSSSTAPAVEPLHGLEYNIQMASFLPMDEKVDRFKQICNELQKDKRDQVGKYRKVLFYVNKGAKTADVKFYDDGTSTDSYSTTINLR